MIEATIWGSVLVCSLAIIRPLVFDRMEKKYLVCLWMIVCVRFLIIAGGPISLNLPEGLREAFSGTRETPAPAVIIREIDPAGNKAENDVDAASDNNIRNDEVTPYYETSTDNGTQYSKVLRSIYLSGVVALALFFVCMYLMQDIRSRKAIPVTEKEIIRHIDGFGLKRKVRPVWIDKKIPPFTYGLLRPRIVLPLNLMNIGDEGLGFIITHEMVHIKKWDYLKKLLISTTLVMYWFDPLVWVMYILSNRDIEYDCDERVVNIMGGESRKGYASTILMLIERGNGSVLSGNSFSGGTEEERIKTIISSGKKRPYRHITFVLAMAAMIPIGFLFGFGTLGNDIKADSNNEESHEQNISETGLVSTNKTTEAEPVTALENKTYTEETETPDIMNDRRRLASEFQKYYTSRYDGVGDISAEVSSVLTASADVAKENLARKEGLIRGQDAAHVVYYSVYCNIEDLETEPLDGKTKVTLSEFVTVNYRVREISDSFSFKIPHVIILTEEMVIASDVYNENTVSGFDNTHETI